MKEEFWTRARVSERIDWAPSLFSLRFDTSLESFRPGQFTAVGLDVDDSEEGGAQRKHRLYSIASAPDAPPEFFFVEIEGGAVSPFLSNLQPGDEAWVHRQAKGVFTLDRIPEARDLWLVATGTGLAPFLSMIRTEEPWGRFERIVIVQGVRLNSELAYAEEMAECSAAHDDRLSLVRLVTREDPAEGVLSGRLTTALETGALEESAGVALDPEHSQIMLCGNPAMIQQTTAALEERGFRENRKKTPGHMTFERYW